jgi:hypothetical protein
MVLLSWEILIFGVAAVMLGIMFVLIRSDSPRLDNKERKVTCPADLSPAVVRLDVANARRTMIESHRQMQLQSCSHWPDRSQCDQECMVQIEAGPAVLDRIFNKWYDRKACALCGAPLSDLDWRWNRFAAIDAEHKFFVLADFDLPTLPGSLEGCWPICWTCHKKATASRPEKEHYFLGDRRKGAAKARPFVES